MNTACKYCKRPDCFGACVDGLARPKPEQPATHVVKEIRPAPKPLPKGELIGYRCWNIGTFRTADPDLVEVGNQLAIPYAIVLRSMNGVPWPGPVIHADEKPDRYNSNGIYVLKHDKRRYDESAAVSGSIMLYGKIVEHRDGYRAEHAMVRSLTLHVANIEEHLSYPESGEKNTIAQQIVSLATVLEHRYECEVLIDTSEADMSLMAKFMYRVKMGSISAADLAALAKQFGA